MLGEEARTIHAREAQKISASIDYRDILRHPELARFSKRCIQSEERSVAGELTALPG